MESKSKSAYEIFARKNEVPLFSQPWYLDIVSKGAWEVMIAKDKQGILGAWPYVLSRKAGFRKIQMPIYTPALGPVIRKNKHQNAYKRLSEWNKLVKELHTQLPKHAFLRVKLNPDGKSWYPFHTIGYKQTTRYTYIISRDRSLDDCSSSLKKQLRNVVTKEIHLNRINSWEDEDSFTEMVSRTFSENQIGNFLEPTIIKSIIQISRQRGTGTIWKYTLEEKVVGAIFIIEDARKSYLLFTSATEEGKRKEAVACLIWHAIKHSLGKGLSFDFEGSMIPGVEKFFRGFGGEQVPYHQITKINSPLMKLYDIIRS